MKESNPLMENGEFLQEALSETIMSQAGSFVRACELVLSTFLNGSKLLICGNGGSAADSQHIAAEFVSSFKRENSRIGLPAIALTTDTSIITAYSNDFDFSGVFARQVEALGNEGDLLIALSSSGESKNCIKAIATARSKKMNVLVFSRQDSTMSGLSDVSLDVVKSSDTQRIQEVHIFLYHNLCEYVEAEYLRRRK